jgi:hypothetical protein
VVAFPGSSTALLIVTLGSETEVRLSQERTGARLPPFLTSAAWAGAATAAARACDPEPEVPATLTAAATPAATVPSTIAAAAAQGRIPGRRPDFLDIGPPSLVFAVRTNGRCANRGDYRSPRRRTSKSFSKVVESVEREGRIAPRDR